MILNRNLYRKEEEVKMSLEGRLPPGQSLTQKFPVLHYGIVPGFDQATWDFRVYGEVESEIRWNWAEFQKLPRTQIKMDIHCVTRWSKFDTLWSGISVRTLMDEGLIKLRPTAKYVIQHADPQYTTNLPLEIVLQDSFLLATHYDGHTITPDHGYPVRGVILERCKMAASLGVHLPGPVGFLGKGRLPQRR
jgi:DMSO/TMAO reductase YedYZ molybdopterin-dependent catalytic subunit